MAESWDTESKSPGAGQMPLFNVTIRKKETTEVQVEIEADSERMAESIAYTMTEDGDIDRDMMTFVEDEFDILEIELVEESNEYDGD